MNIIQQLEKEERDRLLATRTIPDFQPGDTVRVNVKIKEGERERVQAYEGVCIARPGGGINESFTVRKISYGEGVERVFPSTRRASTKSRSSVAARPPRQALLPARSSRQVGPHRRAPEAPAKRLNAAFKGFKRPKGEAEDLTRIKGVGADLAAQLNGLGVIKFDQIANFSDDDIANVDETLKLNGPASSATTGPAQAVRP